MLFAPIVFVVHMADAASFSGARPKECAVVHANAWERAKAPSMRAYCDLIASATSKLTSGRENARAALVEAEEAEKLAPERPAARILHARALERLAKPEEAFQAFTAAQKLDPRSVDEPAVLLSYARTLARTKRMPEAESAYRTLLPRASFLDSRDRAAAYIEAGLLLMQKGPANIDETVAIFRQARAEAQDSTRAVSLVLLALALDRSGDVAQAQAVLGDRGDVRSLFEEARIREILETVSAEPEAIAAVAETLSKDKPQEAKDAWARYVKAAPKSPWLTHAQEHGTPKRAAQTRPPAMKRTLALAVGVLALIASPGAASAETRPTLWDSAKDPAAKEHYATHVAAMNEIVTAESVRTPGVRADWGLQKARQILEFAHAAESTDPQLRYDLGYVYERLELNAAAVAVLTSALAMAPNHVDAERGWGSLSYAFARMDRPDSELAAYDQYLRLEVDESSRATALSNMAEAEMRRGNLREAITGYEDAQRISQDVRTGGGVLTYILAIWGLAVAKDRIGDATGAMIEARRAVSHDSRLFLISEDVLVFFVPAYERLYYLGMGELALSTDATDARAKLLHMERAERRFAEYVRSAASDDRWLARAKEHRTFAQKRQQELKKSLPPAPEEEEP